MSFKEESIQLIATNQFNKFQLTEEGRRFLLNINNPIAVVSIAGAYRTGKSYLVNRLIKSRQLGFRTGASTQSVTKGLSVWGRPIAATDEFGHQLSYIVIDSEGIGSCQQEIKYDMKLLTLVFLISSTVIYNSMGAIDELALDQLRVVTNLKNCYPTQTTNEKTKLVWVLRDFALQLIDRNGCEMTPNEYLEYCLEDAAGSSSEVKKKNEIRRAIRENLRSKVCYTLVRPTINEEELIDLNKAKIRTEFVSQIETIREEVFSGSHEDLKKIRGHPLNGKLLADLLEECIGVLNSNGLPELSSIWESVKSLAYQQFFQSICCQMKAQVSKVAIPMSKDNLKGKLNEIENKFYIKMEEEYLDGDSFKKYHRQFLKVLQKMNKQVKKSNQKMMKQKVLKQLREFVKENICITSIQPCNLSLLKTIIDRMELKVKGQPEGYQYVMSVLFDLMHISEQKAIAQQKQLSQYKRIAQQSSYERKNSDLNILALKKDYHQALKNISNLKTTQQQTQKQIALLKHQLQTDKITNKNLQQQWEIRQARMLRQIEEGNNKNRQKGEELSYTLKRLREENTELLCELSQMREEKLRESLNEKKELIFEEKMREAWDRFDEERKSMRSEINGLRRDVQEWKDKYQQQRKAREKQSEEYIKDREAFSSKQRQFSQQLKEIKNLHAETKKTYTATFDTMKDNDRIFRSIENVALSNSKLASCRKTADEKENNAAKKFYEAQLQKMKVQHDEESSSLRCQLLRLKRLNQQQARLINHRQSELQSYRQEKDRLERQLAYTSQRFADTVSEIETAKQRERSLYEQSIIRLLGNLDKRQAHRR